MTDKTINPEPNRHDHQPEEWGGVYPLLEEQGFRPMVCEFPVEHPVLVISVLDDSMKGAGFLIGDRLKVEVTQSVEDGDTVLASIDGECTVRSFFANEEEGHWLVPCNDAYKPVPMNGEAEVRIFGRVTDLLKSVPRIPYAQMAQRVWQAREEGMEAVPVEERVERAVNSVADKIRSVRQWYAVYRALVSKRAFPEESYDKFAAQVRRMYPNHRYPIEARELRRMEYMSFRKTPLLWDKTDAPVTGKRFDDYYRIAMTVMDKY